MLLQLTFVYCNTGGYGLLDFTSGDSGGYRF